MVDGVPVHRIVFAYHNGGLDPNLVVRHSCDNPLCVNPDHLLSGTHADNMRDMLDRGRQYQQKKTHCPAGHLLVEGNLVASGASRGHRKCLTCARENSQAQANLIREARKVLGLSKSEYGAQYGWSVDAAKAVLASRVAW